MKKRMLSLLCLTLVALMMLSAMTSCAMFGDKQAQESGSESESADETTKSNPGDDTSPRYDEDGRLLDDLDGIDLDGATINILVGSGRSDCFVNSSNMGTDPVNVAVFSRNKTVETRLNCELRFFEEPDGYYNRGSFVSKVQALSGSDGLDLVGVYSLTASNLMIEGLSTDMMKSQNLNFDAPWWSPLMVEESQIYNRLYYCSGDISHKYYGEAFALHMNKNLANTLELNGFVKTNYGYDTIYDLVRSGKWTIDKLIEIADYAGTDRGESGVKEEVDTYGFLGYASSAVDGFYWSSGLRCLENGEDGSVIISSDMGSEKAINLEEKLEAFFKTSTVAVNGSVGAAALDNVYDRAWKNGNGLFFCQPLSATTAKTDFTLGVIPMPKHDEAQTETNDSL